MKFQYRQWHKGPIIAGIGFDPDEWTQVRLVFDVCVKHREACFEAHLLGVSVELMLTSEPE